MACLLFTTLINGANIEVYIDFSKKNFIFPSKQGLLLRFFGQKSTVACRLTALCVDKDQSQSRWYFLNARLFSAVFVEWRILCPMELLLFVGCCIVFVHWTCHFRLLTLIF